MDIIGGQHHLTAFPLLRMYPSIVCDRLYNSCMLSYVLFRFLNILKHRVVDLCRINTAETTAFSIAVNAEHEAVLFGFHINYMSIMNLPLIQVIYQSSLLHKHHLLYSGYAQY